MLRLCLLHSLSFLTFQSTLVVLEHNNEEGWEHLRLLCTYKKAVQCLGHYMGVTSYIEKHDSMEVGYDHSEQTHYIFVMPAGIAGNNEL